MSAKSKFLDDDEIREQLTKVNRALDINEDERSVLITLQHGLESYLALHLEGAVNSGAPAHFADVSKVSDTQQ